MRKCIFCGRTEAEFIDGNKWTEEHIIPESLGNETLKMVLVRKWGDRQLNQMSNSPLILTSRFV